MYTAGPPGTEPPAPAGDPLRVSRVARQRFTGAAAFAASPGHQAHLREYLADLAQPYGVALRERTFADVEGHSYGEMGAALIAAVVPPEQPVDLLVLAYAVPDIRPGRATATYLSEICPGRPFAFAVTDQGAAAPYTGLRLVGEYVRTGGCRRAVLLVLEQAARHLESPMGPAPPYPHGHAGVALRFDATGPARVGPMRQHPDVAPSRVSALLAAEVADIAGAGAGPAGERAVALILGAGLDLVGDEPPLAGRVRHAPTGQPATGAWWELAGTLAEPAESPRRVVLADYDPALRYLCLSIIDAGRAAVALEGGGTCPTASW